MRELTIDRENILEAWNTITHFILYSVVKYLFVVIARKSYQLNYIFVLKEMVSTKILFNCIISALGNLMNAY